MYIFHLSSKGTATNFKCSKTPRSLQCIWHSCPKAALQALCHILCPVPSDVPCPHLSCALNTSYFRDHLRYLSCASTSAAMLPSIAFQPGCNLIRWSRSALGFPRACRNGAYSKGMLKVPDKSQSFLCHQLQEGLTPLSILQKHLSAFSHQADVYIVHRIPINSLSASLKLSLQGGKNILSEHTIEVFHFKILTEITTMPLNRLSFRKATKTFHFKAKKLSGIHHLYTAHSFMGSFTLPCSRPEPILSSLPGPAAGRGKTPVCLSSSPPAALELPRLPEKSCPK